MNSTQFNPNKTLDNNECLRLIDGKLYREDNSVRQKSNFLQRFWTRKEYDQNKILREVNTIAQKSLTEGNLELSFFLQKTLGTLISRAETDNYDTYKMNRVIRWLLGRDFIELGYARKTSDILRQARRLESVYKNVMKCDTMDKRTLGICENFNRDKQRLTNSLGSTAWITQWSKDVQRVERLANFYQKLSIVKEALAEITLCKAQVIKVYPALVDLKQFSNIPEIAQTLHTFLTNADELIEKHLSSLSLDELKELFLEASIQESQEKYADLFVKIQLAAKIILAPELARMEKEVNAYIWGYSSSYSHDEFFVEFYMLNLALEPLQLKKENNFVEALSQRVQKANKSISFSEVLSSPIRALQKLISRPLTEERELLKDLDLFQKFMAKENVDYEEATLFLNMIKEKLRKLQKPSDFLIEQFSKIELMHAHLSV